MKEKPIALKFCSFCMYPAQKNKLIPCASCGKYFCKNCLTEVFKATMMCDACILNLVKNDTWLIITKK